MLRTFQLNNSKGWAGGERQTFLLAKGLQERGHEALLLVQPHGELARRAMEAGLAVEPLRTRSELALVGVQRLRALLKERRPDIVHTHTGHSHMHGWRACFWNPQPALVISRRVDFSIHKMPFRLSLIKFRLRVDRVVAISQAVRDVLVRDDVPADRIGVVRSGVETGPAEAARPVDLDAEFGVEPGAPAIVTVAGLVDHKGHRYLLDAVPEVLKRRPDAKFILVGGGPLERQLRTMVEQSGTPGAVLFAGTREAPLDIVAAADLFVMPSHMEGLNTSVIDAMLLRRPIVVTAAGGLAELIDDRERGRVVPTKDPVALASAILDCLENPDRARQWGEAARAWALEHTTADRMVDGMVREYELALEKRKRGGSPPP
ncbi:MAG: glycosyltransferase family 4 protein [Planctomycetota bacterium]|jgi:glycosyltransferase involved in cell wall biosynthesis